MTTTVVSYPFFDCRQHFTHMITLTRLSVVCRREISRKCLILFFFVILFDDSMCPVSWCFFFACRRRYSHWRRYLHCVSLMTKYGRTSVLNRLWLWLSAAIRNKENRRCFLNSCHFLFTFLPNELYNKWTSITYCSTLVERIVDVHLTSRQTQQDLLKTLETITRVCDCCYRSAVGCGTLFR